MNHTEIASNSWLNYFFSKFLDNYENVRVFDAPARVGSSWSQCPEVGPYHKKRGTKSRHLGYGRSHRLVLESAISQLAERNNNKILFFYLLPSTSSQGITNRAWEAAPKSERWCDIWRWWLWVYRDKVLTFEILHDCCNTACVRNAEE